jgi:uncharacterized protein (TIGR02246 family)
MYIPVIDAAMVYVDTSKRRAGLIEGNFDLAFFFPEDYDPKALESLLGKLPSLDSLTAGGRKPQSRGFIRAVDPVTGKIAWEQQTESIWDGGILSTAGNLVIRGDSAGYLNVYSADSGALLKRIDLGSSIMAAPMTYRVNGTQYISVMAGYGGGVLFLPFPANSAAYKYGNEGRIITLRLDGGAVPKPAPVSDQPTTPPPPREGSAATLAQGEVLYNRFCARCHSFGRALLPDLRNISPATHKLFYEIVLRGVYQAKGMGRWDDVLSQADAEAIHAYLIDQAWQLQSAAPAAANGKSHLTQPGVSPELKHSWEVAFNRGDAAAVAALYAQDAQLVMSGSSPVRGRAGIEEAVRRMIQSGVKVRIASEQNLGSGSLAYVSGPYAVLEGEGGREVETGQYVEVWSNHEGTWLIDLDVNAAGTR